MITAPTRRLWHPCRIVRIARLTMLAVALAVNVHSDPARASITPEARTVVDKFITATGGRAAFDSIRTIHVRGTLSAFGLTGRIEVWLEAPNHRSTEVALGPLTLRDGCDGTHAWRTDPSGKAIVLDGKDLDEALGSTWFDNDRWLTADQGGGNVTLAGVERDSTGNWTVLEVAPPAGRVRRIYLDSKTWLIGRIVSKNDQMTITATQSDYRTVAGRKVAFRTLQQVAGMAANDAAITTDSMWVNVPVATSHFALPGPAQGSGVQWLKNPGVAHLPFTYSAKHVWLRASVNGRPPADFIYDTGASLSVLDSAYAASIGVASEGRIQGQGAGSTGSGAFASLSSLRVQGEDGDGIEIKDSKVAVLNLNDVLEPFFWRATAGIVGFDFIVRFVNEVDFDHHTLTFYDPAKFAYQGKGTAIPMTLAGHVPAVKFTLDGKYGGDFRIDVGSGSTVDLHGPFVKKNGIERLIGTPIEVMGGGFGGTFTSKLGRAKSLAVGPYSWERPLVSISGVESGALSSEDYAGNVGNQILERFKCTVDYERRQLYLEPGAQYQKTDSFSRSGLQLAKYEDEVHAARVTPGSPAAKAGIESGDVIVTIAGKPATGYTVDEADGLLDTGPAGSKVKLELMRGGKKKSVTVTLKDML